MQQLLQADGESAWDRSEAPDYYQAMTLDSLISKKLALWPQPTHQSASSNSINFARI